MRVCLIGWISGRLRDACILGQGSSTQACKAPHYLPSFKMGNWDQVKAGVYLVGQKPLLDCRPVGLG